MRVLIIEDETYNFESLKRKLLRLYPWQILKVLSQIWWIWNKCYTMSNVLT